MTMNSFSPGLIRPSSWRRQDRVSRSKTSSSSLERRLHQACTTWWLPPGRRCVTLGTDGFGRSDTRAALRAHFEVNAAAIVQAALRALASDKGSA